MAMNKFGQQHFRPVKGHNPDREIARRQRLVSLRHQNPAKLFSKMKMLNLQLFLL
jgi:hypothetical protein